MAFTPLRHAIFAKLRLAVCTPVFGVALGSSAQYSATPDTLPPPPASGQYVLHAYTDLLQIPTMVLDRFGSPLGNLDLRSFKLQIDSGPPFQPSALHTEVDDPLSLALVMDASGAQSDLITALTGAPGSGIPVTLLPEDTFSVYAFDCRIFRSAADVPAGNPDLAGTVATVLASPRLHNPGGKTCPDKKHLWDALAVAAKDLSRQPGKRAIIVISDGQDYGSAVKWEDLREYTAHESIALFGLRETTGIRDMAISSFSARGIRYSQEDLFTELSGRTGGVVLPTGKEEIGGQLEHVIALLRSRYILQFRRPQMPGGEHHLEVHITLPYATAHAAGISVPVRDNALWNDPSTVPTDTSKLPVAGKRKPLRP